jgi:hypothetical protein
MTRLFLTETKGVSREELKNPPSVSLNHRDVRIKRFLRHKGCILHGASQKTQSRAFRNRENKTFASLAEKKLSKGMPAF